MKIFLLFFFCCNVFFCSVKAQESLNTAGGNVSGSAGNIGYTIGQLAFMGMESGDGSSTEGIQQSFEISTAGMNKMSGIDFVIKVYPNPTSNFIVLSLSKLSSGDLNYSLYDLLGKELSNKIIHEELSTISMSGLASGTYILVVKKKNLTIQTFKITKNN